MISLASIATHYRTALTQRYAHLMRPQHHRALSHIIDCHTPQCGELRYHCDGCQHSATYYPSCGDRHCPACQHQCNQNWLAAQQQKLLPVDYYLVGFTVPQQLRGFFWYHQKWAYHALITAAIATLQSFFKRDRQLGDRAGMVAVLHTHSRQLRYHPHVHVMVPGGAVNNQGSRWLSKPGKYLFRADNLAKVFRGKFIAAMLTAGFYLPSRTPTEWNADCAFVGRGDSALTYLARYLYRGVLNEHNILAWHNDNITFQYQDNATKRYKTLTEPAVAFLWRVLQHVLPKGFRRSRNYGFLHGNGKRLLWRLQLMLRVRLPQAASCPKRGVCCPRCQQPMRLCLIRRGRDITTRLKSHNKDVPNTKDGGRSYDDDMKK